MYRNYRSVIFGKRIETDKHYFFTMFGLKNGPARFCELIAEVLKNMRYYVFTYMDDFIIFSTDTNRHIHHLYNVLEALDRFGLKINEKNAPETA